MVCHIVDIFESCLLKGRLMDTAALSEGMPEVRRICGGKVFVHTNLQAHFTKVVQMYLIVGERYYRPRVMRSLRHQNCERQQNNNMRGFSRLCMYCTIWDLRISPVERSPPVLSHQYGGSSCDRSSYASPCWCSILFRRIRWIFVGRQRSVCTTMFSKARPELEGCKTSLQSYTKLAY